MPITSPALDMTAACWSLWRSSRMLCRVTWLADICSLTSRYFCSGCQVFVVDSGFAGSPLPVGEEGPFSCTLYIISCVIIMA